MSGDEIKKDAPEPVENGSATATTEPEQQLNGKLHSLETGTPPGDFKQLILDGLEKKSNGSLWLWWVNFFQCASKVYIKVGQGRGRARYCTEAKRTVQ